MSTGGIHVIKLLFLCLLLISFIIGWGAGWLAKNVEEHGDNYFSSLA